LTLCGITYILRAVILNVNIGLLLKNVLLLSGAAVGC